MYAVGKVCRHTQDKGYINTSFYGQKTTTYKVHTTVYTYDEWIITALVYGP